LGCSARSRPRHYYRKLGTDADLAQARAAAGYAALVARWRD
jgi:hypothetical protein